MDSPGLARHILSISSTTSVVPVPVRPAPVSPAPVREEESTDESNEEYASDYPWHVVLLDDNQHTYDYVIEMLMAIFGYKFGKAFAMACEVDSRGRVIVATCHLERAEMHQQQIHTYGPDWRIPSCKGSMSAVLQQAR